MRIIGKAPRLFCVDGVDLFPGSQIITGESENRIRSSKYFAEQVKIGNFEIADESASEPRQLTAAEKIAVIRETLVDEELDKLEEGETRKGVLQAIKEQRAALREGRENGNDE